MKTHFCHLLISPGIEQLRELQRILNTYKSKYLTTNQTLAVIDSGNKDDIFLSALRVGLDKVARMCI